MAYQSSLNSTTLIGRLTHDPELRTTSTSAGDRAVLSLGLAVRKPSKLGNEDVPTPEFFDVTVWGTLAETCSRHLYKGRLVAVSARLEPSAWEAKDGSKRRDLKIVASAIDFLDSPRNTRSPEGQLEDAPIAA
jgi:single-strand DNA-binding protein